MGISPAHSARLQEDLRLGGSEGIFYRRNPKVVTVEGKPRVRSYYDADRPNRPSVTEHYYLRVYKAHLKGTDQAQIVSQINKRARRRTPQAQLIRDVDSKLWSAYMLRQEAIGDPVTGLNLGAKQADFEIKARELRAAQDEARKVKVPPASKAFKAKFFATGSRYSNALVDMGQRLGNETWAIGDSPNHAGDAGYYFEVVRPTLMAGTLPMVAEGPIDPERQELIDELTELGSPPNADASTDALKRALKRVYKEQGIIGG